MQPRAYWRSVRDFGFSLGLLLRSQGTDHYLGRRPCPRDNGLDSLLAHLEQHVDAIAGTVQRSYGIGGAFREAQADGVPHRWWPTAGQASLRLLDTPRGLLQHRAPLLRHRRHRVRILDQVRAEHVRAFQRTEVHTDGQVAPTQPPARGCQRADWRTTQQYYSGRPHVDSVAGASGVLLGALLTGVPRLTTETPMLRSCAGVGVAMLFVGGFGTAVNTQVRPPVIDIHVHSTNTTPREAKERMDTLNIRYLFVSSLASDAVWAAAMDANTYVPALVAREGAPIAEGDGRHRRDRARPSRFQAEAIRAGVMPLC